MTAPGGRAAFDVARVPFSHFGSWMSIAIKGKEPQLFRRSHHNKQNSLFVLKPTSAGEEVPYSASGRPHCLTLEADGGIIELCFQSTGTLRMRRSGLGLPGGCGPRNSVWVSSGRTSRPTPAHQPGSRCESGPFPLGVPSVISE